MIGICFAKTPEAVQFYDLLHKRLTTVPCRVAEKPAPAIPSPNKPSAGKRPNIGAPLQFKYL